MRSNRRAISGLTLASAILLVLQAAYPTNAFAGDGEQSLGNSNFTGGLPQSNFDPGVFRYRSPLGGALSPYGQAGGSMAPPLGSGSLQPMGSADQSFSPFSALQSQQSPGDAASRDERTDSRVAAWYKFLEPSLNLSRTLGESERHRLLPTVPMPPDIKGRDRRKSDNYMVLLRASNSPEYACFKTIWGSLFGRSGTLILVSSAGLVVRMLNLNGREKDVLFKLPNGQIITIGPGSEMILSKVLSPHDVSISDGIARRGLTRTMECSEMQMAFSQFSFTNVFELPEMKFYTKNQNQKELAALRETVAQINEMRGTDGFKQAMAQEEPLPIKERQARSSAPRAKKVVVKLVPVKKKPFDENSSKTASKNMVARDQYKDELNHDATYNDREDRQKKLAKAKAEETEAEHKKELALKIEAARKKEHKVTSLQESAPETAKPQEIIRKFVRVSQRHLFGSVSALKLKERKAKNGEPADSRKQIGMTASTAKNPKQTDMDTGLPSATAAAKPKLKDGRLILLGGKIKDTLAKKINETRAPKQKVAGQVSTVPVTSTTTKYLLPRKIPGTNTAPEIAKLLLEANREEKDAAALRKRADNCIEYMNSGLMSYEQQKRMETQARQALKLANEAEERSQALRRQVEIAGSGKYAVQ